jgi:hypothetical protein
MWLTRPLLPLRAGRPQPRRIHPNVRSNAPSRRMDLPSSETSSWNQALETGGVLVGDKIKLELELSALKPAATAAG